MNPQIDIHTTDERFPVHGFPSWWTSSHHFSHHPAHRFAIIMKCKWNLSKGSTSSFDFWELSLGFIFAWAPPRVPSRPEDELGRRPSQVLTTNSWASNHWIPNWKNPSLGHSTLAIDHGTGTGGFSKTKTFRPPWTSETWNPFVEHTTSILSSI